MRNASKWSRSNPETGVFEHFVVVTDLARAIAEGEKHLDKLRQRATRYRSSAMKMHNHDYMAPMYAAKASILRFLTGHADG